MTSYRMNVKCDRCKKTYTTIKKNKNAPPARCKYCNSSMIRILSSWKVK
jgi:DNA-directed RNA polymerase subunit RPC12/RpoP